MEIKYANMLNGKFAICPKCSKVMADRVDFYCKTWECLFGCGLVVKEKSGKNKEIA